MTDRPKALVVDDFHHRTMNLVDAILSLDRSIGLENIVDLKSLPEPTSMSMEPTEYVGPRGGRATAKSIARKKQARASRKRNRR